MSRAAREVGELLAGQLEQFETQARGLAAPYAQAAEYRRRIKVAEAALNDQDCSCGTVKSLPPYIIDVECARCYLLRVLCGDLA
jgi:hypothetical protein